MDEKLVMIMTAICALTICLVLSVIVQWRRSEKVRRRMRYYYGKWREAEYSDAVLSVIKEYTNHKEKMIDDITWNDLNMDKVFQKMNHTWSFAGEDYLYYLLHIPTNADGNEIMPHWGKQENMISYFQEHEKERTDLQMIFAKIGKYHGASVYQFIQDSIAQNTSVPFVHYVCLLALIVSIGCLLTLKQELVFW